MIKTCKVCNKPLTFIRRWKYCKNLACIKYNVKLRRYDGLRNEEKTKVQEEE